VEFYDRRDAMDALDHLDRYEMDGRELAVVFAKDRRKTADEMRPRSNGGRSDSRDRGRGGDRRGGRESRDRDRCARL
jgi:RNA recognition motif-containing protein